MSSSTKLEKRVEQVLPGSKGVGEERAGGEQEGEMVRTMYAHMNKWINNKRILYLLFLTRIITKQ
jgi:hypothetical protein